MTKEQIKTICEDDDKMEWWAMMLFAEIAEIMMSQFNAGYAAANTMAAVKKKTEEFDKLLQQRVIEKIKEKDADLITLEKRVAAIEIKVFGGVQQAEEQA